MKISTTTLTTEAAFSEDGKKRYLLHKEWDTGKPQIAIIMLAPSDADGISLDKTTLQVLNNTVRLGYGGVYILNLFSTLNDYALRMVDVNDEENMQVFHMVLDKVDTVIYAPGVGKAKNQIFIDRQKQICEILKAHETKLQCLCDDEGKSRLQHPLSPAVHIWYLSKVTVREILGDSTKEVSEKKVSRIKKKTVLEDGTPFKGN